MSASVVSVTTGRRIGRGQGATANAEGPRRGSRIRGCRRACAGHALTAIREGVIAAKQEADLGSVDGRTSLSKRPSAPPRSVVTGIVGNAALVTAWRQGPADRPTWRRASSKTFALSDQNSEGDVEHQTGRLDPANTAARAPGQGRGLARGIVTRMGRDGSPARGGRHGRVEPGPGRGRDAPSCYRQGRVSQATPS